jgi:CheY-like chemotaxis protein
MKILVVDDDPDFLAVFLNVLNQLGFGTWSPPPPALLLWK